MKNVELARILYLIGEILELEKVEWKPRAYQKAAQTIENLSEDVEKIYKEKGLQGLDELPGVGASIAKKIEEFIKTGKIKEYEKLKKKVPVDLEGLGKVPGLGPAKIKLLYKKLGIKNLKDLEKALQKQKLRQLGGLGATTEENLQQGIEFIKKSGGRMLLGSAYPIALELKEKLSKISSRVEIAGSFRRGRETVGDLDLLAISKKPGAVIEEFVKFPEVKKIVAKGPTRAAVILRNNLEVDLRVLKEKEFGSALQYFTGNKQHNIAVRKLALKKGFTLSEYGLFTVKGKKWVCGRTEEEIYKKLGMQYIEPELRVNEGEIEAALKNKLPKLINLKDVRGDFQMHTTWSDGANSIAEMVKEGERRGYKVMAITDHIGNIGVTNSLKGKRFDKYCQEIDKINKKSSVRVLKGAEIDIDKNGKLLATPEMLKKLDIVLAAIHMGIKGDQTKRIIYALENYPVNVLAHPTDRKIMEREGLKMDLEKVFETAKRTNTFLEIDGQPKRIDLRDTHVKLAKEIGCKFSFGSDAHSVEGMEHLKFSVVNARRGWLEKKDVLNCWDSKKIMMSIKK